MVPSKSFAPAKQIHKALIQKITKGLAAEQFVRDARSSYKVDSQTNAVISNKRFLENLPKQSKKIIIARSRDNKIPSKATFLNGFWVIQLIWDSKNNSSFTIGTLVSYDQGEFYYRYHPNVIEDHIVTAFGEETYQIWKKQILGNLDDLRSLIKVVKDFLHLGSLQPITSVACCKRSEVLCRRVGLPVVDGIVILQA